MRVTRGSCRGLGSVWFPRQRKYRGVSGNGRRAGLSKRPFWLTLFTPVPYRTIPLVLGLLNSCLPKDTSYSCQITFSNTFCASEIKRLLRQFFITMDLFEQLFDNTTTTGQERELIASLFGKSPVALNKSEIYQKKIH